LESQLGSSDLYAEASGDEELVMKTYYYIHITQMSVDAFARIYRIQSAVMWFPVL